MSSTVCSTGLSCTSKSNTCLCRVDVAIDNGSAVHAAQTHSEGKALVIVRVPKNDELSLTTALDAGAAGIIIPHVESAQEVKDMMKEMYYRETPDSLSSPSTKSSQHHWATAPSAPGLSHPAYTTPPCTPRISTT
jgi:citrate lyase beta subunit